MIIDLLSQKSRHFKEKQVRILPDVGFLCRIAAMGIAEGILLIERSRLPVS